MPALIRALDDPSALLRANATAVLGSMGDPDGLRAVTRMRSDDDADVRLTALYALGEMAGEGAVQPLLDALGSTDTATRAAAVAMLASTGEPRGVPALMGALADPAPRVRYEAILGLASLALPDVAQVLDDLLDDPDVLVRSAAAEAMLPSPADTATEWLGPLPEEMLGALDHSDAALRAEAVFRAGQLYQVFPDTVLTALWNALDDPDETVRLEAAGALAQLGKTELLIFGMGASEAVRQSCVSALARFQPPRLVASLLDLLIDPDEAVSTGAADVLAAIPEKSCRKLVRLLAGKRRAPAAIKVLRRIGKPAVGALISIMLKGGKPARKHAEGVLVMIGRPAVRPLIDKLYSDAPKSRRQRMAEVLERIGHPAGFVAVSQFRE